MGNRSRTEIVSNILEAANGGVTKTKIMYKAYLFSSIKNIFVLMKDNIPEYIDRNSQIQNYR